MIFVKPIVSADNRRLDSIKKSYCYDYGVFTTYYTVLYNLKI